MKRRALLMVGMLLLPAIGRGQGPAEGNRHMQQRIDATWKLVLMEPVAALMDIYAAPQQVAFRSLDRPCQFSGTIGRDASAHVWVISITKQTCGSVAQDVNAKIIPPPIDKAISEESPLLRAGEGAILKVGP